MTIIESVWSCVMMEEKNKKWGDSNLIEREPEFLGTKIFDVVDGQSNDNKIIGHTNKWCRLADISYIQDYILDVKNNPSSAFQSCFTNEEIMNGNIPKHVSVYIKEMVDDKRVDVEVIACFIMNYFGLPTAYNTNITGIKDGDGKNYLMSVDFLRKNEELVLLQDLIENRNDYFDINVRMLYDGDFKINLSMIQKLLKNKLNSEDIAYTKKDIDEFMSYLVSSTLVRAFLMGDADFKNENAGIIIDKGKKTFRPVPNFDYERCFIGEYMNYAKVLETIFSTLVEIHDESPVEYEKFISKLNEFMKANSSGKSKCSEIINYVIKDKQKADDLIREISRNFKEIMRVSEKCAEKY